MPWTERKSSFLYKASKPEIAVPMYEESVAQMQDLGVHKPEFGADMSTT
jgi:D-Tyr-tRNAtyr deacylase